jgi:alpha-beta hydrolase superfamily lysophospholipase
VYAGTHPPRPTPDADPRSFGIYFDPVTFVGADDLRLFGWLVPVVDARRVVEEKDKILTQRYPAVVLVHDHGQSPQQMLPLVGPLHDDGMVVLAVSLRGEMTGNRCAQTFGLHEASDVRAAVELLRRRPFVDGKRIAVVGVGTGANAALLAAQQDPGIAAVAVADPVSGPDDAVRRRIGPDYAGLRWMQPLCKWTFEVAYHVDAEDMNLPRLRDALGARPVLALESRPDSPTRLDAGTVAKVRGFCHERLASPQGATAASR